MLIQQPEGQRHPHRSCAGQDMMSEALREPGLHQGSRGDFHGASLRSVDIERKGFVYGSDNDGARTRLHTVDVKSVPYPNHLAEWREYRGLTQAELADLVGCSTPSIGHWENGVRRLTDKWLPTLSKVLNAPADYILNHDPDNLPTDIMDIWAAIPERERPRALEVLKAFRTGTDG